MKKLGIRGMVGLMFFGSVAAQAKGPAKIAFKAQPAENRGMWKSVVEQLRGNPMVNARVKELVLEPVAAENSTPAHPTFRANLWLKCAGAMGSKKLHANPSGMRGGEFFNWILRAIQRRCP